MPDGGDPEAIRRAAADAAMVLAQMPGDRWAHAVSDRRIRPRQWSVVVGTASTPYEQKEA